MLAYLMQLAALFNAICFNDAFFAIDLFKCFLFFVLCLGSLTHSLFISNIILHHAQCFQSVGFPNFMFTQFACFSMKGLCTLWRKRT